MQTLRFKQRVRRAAISPRRAQAVFARLRSSGSHHVGFHRARLLAAHTHGAQPVAVRRHQRHAAVEPLERLPIPVVTKC